MSALPRPCLDCGSLTTGSRCTECAPAARTPDRRVGRTRSSRPNRWRTLSERARRVQPWCTRCGATDDLTLDHVVPVAAGGPLVPDAAGTEVLCRRCNSSKGTRSAADDDRGTHPPP